MAVTQPWNLLPDKIVSRLASELSFPRDAHTSSRNCGVVAGDKIGSGHTIYKILAVRKLIFSTNYILIYLFISLCTFKIPAQHFPEFYIISKLGMGEG